MNEKIMELLNQIDEKYIEEAAPGRRHVPWKRYAVIAACLVLAVGVITLVSRLGREELPPLVEDSGESREESKEESKEENIENLFVEKEVSFDRSEYVVVTKPTTEIEDVGGYPSDAQGLYIEATLKKRIEESTDTKERFYVTIRGGYNGMEAERYYAEIEKRFVYEGKTLEEWETEKGTEEYQAMRSAFLRWKEELRKATSTANFNRAIQIVWSLMGEEYDVWATEMRASLNSSAIIAGYLSKEQILHLQSELKFPYVAQLEWAREEMGYSLYDKKMRDALDAAEGESGQETKTYRVMIDVVPMLFEYMFRAESLYQGKSIPEWKSQEVLTIYTEAYAAWCVHPSGTFEEYWQQAQPIEIQEEYRRVTAILEEALAAFDAVYDEMRQKRGREIREEEKKRLAEEGRYNLWIDPETGVLMGDLTAAEMKEFEIEGDFVYRFCLEEREESTDFPDNWAILVDA